MDVQISSSRRRQHAAVGVDWRGESDLADGNRCAGERNPPPPPPSCVEGRGRAGQRAACLPACLARHMYVHDVDIPTLSNTVPPVPKKKHTCSFESFLSSRATTSRPVAERERCRRGGKGTCTRARASLEEILATTSPAGRYGAPVIRDRAEDLEVRVEVLTQGHDGGNVATSITVVRGAPDGDDILGGEVSTGQICIWDVKEESRTHLGGDFVSEKPASSSRTDRPRIDIFWIRPDEIAEGPLVWNLLRSGDNSDLIESSNFGTQPSVYTQHFAVDDGGKGQKVEDLATGLPYRGIAIFLLAFLVESINLCNLS
nr:hypothetical protein CFP56_11877 [Quercus suber]